VTRGPTAPATRPPAGLPGLDPRWSRLVETPDLDGIGRTWHVLDNGVAEPSVTLLCVHGNPTWSYLWRDLLAAAPDDVRVVAVDQLDMVYSERTGTVRRLAQRIDDLDAVVDALDIDGPVVTVAHDWGGPISLGWAERHTDRVAGIVLMNTAVHQPEGSPAPRLIRLVRTPGLLDTICVRTPGFVRGTMTIGRPRPAPDVRAAYEAPYRTPERRRAIAAFVEDIPLDDDHPSQTTLDTVAARLDLLRDVPSLLLWGPSDPVFSDLYLQDLTRRLPDADVHRFEGASHLTPEDAEIAPVIYRWIEDRHETAPATTDAGERTPLWGEIDRRSDDRDVAIVEMDEDGEERSVTFADLADDVHRIAAGLASIGVSPGDRVALLVPPGIDLAACLYGVWRTGGVVVLVDAGLGARGIGRALTGADPAYARRANLDRSGEHGDADHARCEVHARRDPEGRGRGGRSRSPVGRRRCRGRLHLRCDGTGEGRGLPAPPTRGAAGRAHVPLHHPTR